jgi:imidazoleglycerol phosphate dehydratase HisB
MSDDKNRRVDIDRQSRETTVKVSLAVDGTGKVSVRTGVHFFDHMLTALAFHARFDLDLECHGDLEVDDHHTVEDCGLALGEALRQAVGDGRGIKRFGWALLPMDEALARAAVDISGRPLALINLGLKREQLGTLACENLTHFFFSLASAARLTVHLDVLRGKNDHHRAEAACKAMGVALRAALVQDGDQVPSSKGVLL